MNVPNTNFTKEDVNPVDEILSTPDCLDIEGAREIQLTDSSDLQAALRRNPNNANAEVYEWRTTLLPEHERMSINDVRDIVVSLNQDVANARHVAEVQEMKLDEFRVWLMDSNPRYKEFFQKFPRLFRMIVGPSNTPVNINHIMKLIEMKRAHLNSNKTLNQQQMEVGKYYMEHFARPAQPGEEEEAVRTGRGYRGTPLTRDQVRRELQTR